MPLGVEAGVTLVLGGGTRIGGQDWVGVDEAIRPYPRLFPQAVQSGPGPHGILRAEPAIRQAHIQGTHGRCLSLSWGKGTNVPCPMEAPAAP